MSRTRTCLNCGEPYQSEAQTELRMPFCSIECKRWHGMSEEERIEKACTVTLPTLQS